MQLILNTFGTSLTRDNNMFLVVNKDGKQHIHPDNVKSILISKGASITSDAALLAVEKEVEVIFVDAVGQPKGRLWSVKYGSVSTIRRKQLDFTFSKAAIDWIKTIIMNKIDNQSALLLSLTSDDQTKENRVNSAINKLEDYKKKIESVESFVISDVAASLRGWEGAASKYYFETLSLFMPDQYHFNGRSQHPATDVFNCMLNYGYGMLYGKIEGALIKAGIDPYVGVFHRDDYNRPVLVFDVIEKFRVWVDYVVVALLTQQVINEDCYSIKEDGSYWLETLGRRILIQSLNDYMEEIIKMNGLDRTRETHLQLFAQDLAQQFIKFKSEE
ncbi:MAG: CRISPR-associated endonuclease Cas1 [Sphingobacteriia bacterium]|nr:CRISPR-associated endonuclease Cas1 [Sphingobacteriia bacterium]